MRIDAHQHFWLYNAERHSWITEDMKIIQQDFLPADLKPILQDNKVDGCVLVQVDQTKAETDFLLGLADVYSFIKGVVGWVDFQSDTIFETLEYYSHFENIKGFRHIVQAEPSGFLNHPKFIKGVKNLKAFGYTYDLLVYSNQLEEATQFVRSIGNQPVVLDHIGKPLIKTGERFDEWKKNITNLASLPNVMCKLSGLVTEADWDNWTKATFTPYLDHALEAFSSNRLIFGTDWPVCNVAADYKSVINIIEDWTSPLTANEKDQIFGLNAIKFYSIES